MPYSIHQILKKYWGFSQFRPLQEDIINAALAGQDALALLPTGGGKSICFQVPGLAMEGFTLVVSPLIALMKDQVQNLHRLNIPAVAITSGMNHREIDVVLDNAVYGKYKFVYVSPERIETEMFQLRLEKMNINLIAVDESHCISQWGYDFRPSYLNISKLRDLVPKVPVLALTATATPEVVEDIQQKLRFSKNKVFAKSFERKNLHYLVRREEDKLGRLFKLIGETGGSGIVYVRSRRKTEKIARELQGLNIVAEYYHAGLSNEIRDIRQQAWVKNQVQVIVATNAFGMGIDKPDVRWVVHFDLPDTLEAYFQEAGRAGRDENPASATIYYDDADVADLKRRTSISFPNKKRVLQVYQALGNFLQIPDGSSKLESFPFNLKAFCKRYELNLLETYSSLKVLEQEGLVSLGDAIHQPSRLKFLLDKSTFYNLELKEPLVGKLLQLILRSYSGVLDNYVQIDEGELARRLRTTKEVVIKDLKALARRNLIDYLPASDEPLLTFLEEKIPIRNVTISQGDYDWRKKRAFDKMNSMIDYVIGDHCRSAFLLNYFGQANEPNCGICDYCLNSSTSTTTDIVADRILSLLSEGELLVDEVFEFSKAREDVVIQAIEWLKEEGKIETIEDRVRLAVN